MNISAFGNADRLDVGVALDPTTILEPDVLLDCLNAAFGGFAAGAVAEPGGEGLTRSSSVAPIRGPRPTAPATGQPASCFGA